MIKDFEPFKSENAAETLNNMSPADFLAAKNPSEASEDEVLAALTQLFDFVPVLGQNYLHNLIIDGMLGAWLNRIK